MKVKKKYLNTKTRSKKRGILVKVIPENYELLKSEGKGHYYDTPAKESANKNSANTNGKGDQ